MVVGLKGNQSHKAASSTSAPLKSLDDEKHVLLGKDFPLDGHLILDQRRPPVAWLTGGVRGRSPLIQDKVPIEREFFPSQVRVRGEILRAYEAAALEDVPLGTMVPPTHPDPQTLVKDA